MKERAENLDPLRFPEFFEKIAHKRQLPEKVSIGTEEQQQIEDWVWNQVIRQEAVGVKGSWLYDHMERTSKALEASGINRHDFEHVKTVMVNACAIFLSTQALYLKDSYDLNTLEGRRKLFHKLTIVSIASLFHDIGYLDCIEDEANFCKEDLDKHPLLASEAVFHYGHARIGRPLERARRNKTPNIAKAVKNLLNQVFQPEVADNILQMSEKDFYKTLRKIRSGISSHDSPEKQDVTDEATKLDNVGGEAIAVYLADKTHIGQRVGSNCSPETQETIQSHNISVVHDRITFLVQGERFEVHYSPQEINFKIILNVHIPDSYLVAGYSLANFTVDFEHAFAKRYQHAQKIFRRLMHREHLNNANARLLVMVNYDGQERELLQLPKSNLSRQGRKLSRTMRTPK